MFTLQVCVLSAGGVGCGIAYPMVALAEGVYVIQHVLHVFYNSQTCCVQTHALYLLTGEQWKQFLLQHMMVSVKHDSFPVKWTIYRTRIIYVCWYLYRCCNLVKLRNEEVES